MKKIQKSCLVHFFPFILLFCMSGLHNAYAAIVPSGQTVGIKIYTDGLVVTNISEFWDINGKTVCPARDAGIKKGDIIKSVDKNEITSSEQFKSSMTHKNMSLEIARGDEIITLNLKPLLSDDGQYKAGLWVRDSTAGIGTITCFDNETMEFYALGHAITDVDTGNIMTVNKGNIQNCSIISVTAGKIGIPGAISADFNGENIGVINKNSDSGISGILNIKAPDVTGYKTLSFDEITDGEAYILSDVAGNGIKQYAAKIKRLDKNGTKNMVIEITDGDLLSITGGIVQGMSGCPVIQNGKIVGAVTHVFVNNPTKGYGVFIENMLAAADKIK